MANVHVSCNDNAEGTRGLMAGGGTKRFEQISRMAEAVGAMVESMHFAFGDTDVDAIIDTQPRSCCRVQPRRQRQRQRRSPVPSDARPDDRRVADRGRRQRPRA